MSQPVLLVLLEVSIEGRRTAVPAEARPRQAAGARLTNRAAGRLRAEAADAAPLPSETGGFTAERTAQDDAEVAAAATADATRTTTAQVDAQAATRDTDTPPPSETGGFTADRTAQDDAEVAAADAPATPRTTAAEVDARTAAAVPPSRAAGARGDEAEQTPAPSSTGGFVAERTSQDDAEARAASANAAARGVADPRTGIVATAGGGLDPASITTPDELVTGMRAASAAITVVAPEPAALSTALAPTVAAARARPGRGGGGGRGARPAPVDPITIDPVPAATKAVAAALKATLPVLRLPALATPPAGIPTPVLEKSKVPRLDEGELATTATDLATGMPAVTGKTVTDTEKQRRKKAKTAAEAPVAVTEEPAKPLDPPVLLDLRPPARGPMPQFAADFQKGQILKVLGVIAANVDERAKGTVQEIRETAFDDNAMSTHFPEITDPWRAEVAKAHHADLTKLAESVGLTIEELTSAAETRRKDIEAKASHQATAAELDAIAAAESLTEEAKKKQAEIEKEKRREEARRVQRLRLAMHSHDPKLVDELVSTRLDYLGADVASGVVAIDAAGKRRQDLLTAYEAAYVDAYRRADNAAQAAAKQAAATELDAPAPAPEADWTTTAQEQARTSFAGLRTSTTTATGALVSGLTTAAESARAAIREWREKRLRRVKHVEHERLREATDQEVVKTQITNARAQAKIDANRQQLAGEITFVTNAYLQKHKMIDTAAVGAARAYTDEEMKVADTYLAAGKGDPIAGVAETMAAKHRAEEVTKRTPTLQKAILAMDPTKENVDALADIYFPGGSAELRHRVTELKKAFDGPGTDNDEVYKQLSNISGAPMALLNAAYRIIAGEGLQWRIEDEMSGSDLDQAAGLAGDDGSEHAAAARQQRARGVIADSNGWFSNDPQRALEAIRALPPGEADAVAKDPATKKHLQVVLAGDRFDYGKRAWVEDTRGQDQLDAMLAVNRVVRKPGEPRPPELRWAQARADAIEMDRYVRRGTAGDPPDVDKLFARIRADVLADPESQNWSAAEVDFEIRRRTRDMEKAYQDTFGGEMPEQANAMRAAMARYMWGTNKQLATDLIDVNRAGERATRLQKTTEGVYTSDSEMNTELARTFNDALAEVRRSPAERKKVDEELKEVLKSYGYSPNDRLSPREMAAYRREAEHKVAGALAKGWFAQVDRTFGKRYAHLWGGNPTTALEEMVTDTTQFSSEDEALARIRGTKDESGQYTGGTGGLSAAQSVQFGLAGWGLEKDQVMAGIGGRTTRQLERIGKEFTRNTGENMVDELTSETGGWTPFGKPRWQEKDTDLERDAFDFREALRGVATTPEEEKAALDRRMSYEENVYFADNPAEREMAVGPELANMRHAHARATAAYSRYEAAKEGGDPIAITNAESGMRVARDGVDRAADYYRDAVDAYVERAAQIAAIAAAVLVTVVTWGAAGPLVIALAASVAGTVAAMATKQGILGSAYSKHAVTNDFIVGVVDAALTVLTARLGNVLLKLPRPVGTGKVLQASLKTIEAQKLAKPMLARVGAFAAEQVAQSAPSAVTGALLDRNTWKGDPVRNVAKVAGFASVVGIGVGGVMHGVSNHGPRVFGAALDAMRAMRGGSGADIAAERVMLRSTAEALARGESMGDALAHRGTPAERLAAQREYLKRFPDRTPADFQAALREGTADAVATADAQRALRREMTTELLDGIPPGERRRFLDTPILVLSDADFVANTGSRSKGNAATLILHGEPVVVIRERAPLSALREEGMHVRQIRDVINAERVALLDEEKLARWGRTSLEDRITAWHAKLDLELEVQARTIADLDSRLAGATPERAAAIMRQYDDARAAFDVLTHRRRQLVDLDEAAMARIRSGQQPAPHFLADEPRLFSKSKAPPAEPWVEMPGQPGVLVQAPPVTRQAAGAWVEKVGSRSRERRWVREWDARTAEWRLYEQVRWKEKGARWQMHGDAPRWSGGVGEVAMRIEHTRMVGTDAQGVHRVQIDAQRADGTGFDDVMPEFRTDASGGVEATIVVYEGKYYRGRAGSFTAIDPQFKENLALLKERLERIRDNGAWESAGMTRAQLDAALTAVEVGQIRVVVRTAERTALTDAALRKIQTSLRRRKGLGKRVSVERGADIAATGIVDAEDFFWQLERYRLEGYPGMTKDDAELVLRIAGGANGVSPASLAKAEAVLEARRAAAAVIGPDVRWDPTGEFLVSGGNAIEVVSPGRRPSGRFDHNAEAQEILRFAGRDVQPAGSPTRAPVHVVVDLGALTPGEVQRLAEALKRLSRSGGRSKAYGRTILVNVPTAVSVGAAP